MRSEARASVILGVVALQQDCFAQLNYLVEATPKPVNYGYDPPADYRGAPDLDSSVRLLLDAGLRL
jgi:hypothetical protein